MTSTQTTQVGEASKAVPAGEASADRTGELPALLAALDHARTMANFASEVRMRNFNFFVVVTGILIAGLTQLPAVWSPTVGIAGAIVSALFFGLDVRGRGLVKRSIDQLEILEPIVWQRAGIQGWTPIPRDGGHRLLRHQWIKYDDLSLAFEFVSSAAPMEHRAFVSLDTGKVYWVSELNPIDEEELPDDLDTPGRYLEIPHKNDLDLGRELALRFVEDHLPAHYDRVADIFRKRGAYRRFKEVLASEGCLEQWYAFETEATEQAPREWCQENDIRLGAREGEQSA